MGEETIRILNKILCGSLISGCLIIYTATGVWAADANVLIEAHKNALKQYQEDQDETQAFITLQLAGIEDVLQSIPEGMSKPEYIQILNDFAFFRYKSATFKKDVTTRDMDGTTFKGDERWLQYGQIENSTMRLNRLCQARRILQRVIQLDPDRAVAYLNLADVYWLDGLYSKKIHQNEGEKKFNVNCSTGEEPQWIYDLFDFNSSRQASHFKDRFRSQKDDTGFENIFKAYDIYNVYRKKMIEQGKQQLIPEHVNQLLSRRFLFIMVQDYHLSLPDKNLCPDFEAALNRLPDEELNIKVPDVSSYDPKFKRLLFKDFPLDFQKQVRNSLHFSEKRPDPNHVYEYNNHIYIDRGYITGVYMVLTEPSKQKQFFGMTPQRCTYYRLDFKNKFAYFF